MLDHFNLLAPIYDRLIPPQPPEDLVKNAGLPAAGALLDAAGGTGRISQFLQTQADSIVVADLSFKMLQQAKNKDPLRPVCTSTERLPFPDAYFARVIMVDALHHVHDQRLTAGELWRVLKPGGRLAIEEPDMRIFGVKLVALAEKLALMRSHFLSPQQIAALFPAPPARVRIELNSYNAWILVEKPSKMYSSEGAMENGIEAVMRVASAAPIKDLTQESE